MMMTLLSEASFLGFEGIEATTLKAFFAMSAFMILWIYGTLCKNYAKTMMGEKICSIIEWTSFPAFLICAIVTMVCLIKWFV